MARVRDLGPVEGLEAHDLLQLAVLAEGEVFTGQAAHGPAFLAQDDRVHRHQLDLGREAGGLRAARAGARDERGHDRGGGEAEASLAHGWES
jgi:hypothetical protein